MNIYELFINFMFCSFVGWICEVVYCSVGKRKLVSRGMLYGPICPIYGVGAVIIVYGLSFLNKYPVLLFLTSVILTSLVEYFTSFILEKIFDLKLWDYSKHRFNINGRVCLLNSTLFGIMAIVLIYLVGPYVLVPVNEMIKFAEKPIGITLMAIFGLDVFLTFTSLIHFTKIIENEKKLILNIKNEINVKYNGKISSWIFGHFLNRFPGIKSIKKSSFFESVKAKFEEMKDRIIK